MERTEQFIITKTNNMYTAEGVDLAIVTQAPDLDELKKNIEQATELHVQDIDEQ